MNYTKDRSEFSVIKYIIFISVFLIIAILFSYIGQKYIITDNSIDADTNTSPELPTIIIDAGHGGEDGGAIGKTGVLEKELNLSISRTLADMLISSGYEVVMTRNDDRMLYNPNEDYYGRKKALDLAQRVKISEQYDNAVFVSIHMNSFPDEKYSGLQVYYSKNNENSRILADSIQNLIQEKLQKENHRKTKVAQSNIYVLDRVKKPAILIECGFISNDAECRSLSDEAYRQKLSLGLFAGIVKYLHSTT